MEVQRIDGKPWSIGIQNPLAPTGQHIGVLTTDDKTIVTSGSNERFFILEVIVTEGLRGKFKAIYKN